ncbi:MAG: DUF692 domain-containing protein [Proteobacteria bacterium]|nr:DUF692 domain-containing protein [Pseudomonadota bacterium]
MVSEFLKKTAEGFGLGLRLPHYSEALKGTLRADWLEVITENYLGLKDGRLESPALNRLLKIRENYSIALHGVAMGIGGLEPFDKNYLKRLKELANIIETPWISDHLCWTTAHGRVFHDLIPLPYNEETLNYLVSRIKEVQDFLGRRILVENVSAYVDFESSTMFEWDFISELATRADCYLLCDLNNIFVSSYNQNFNPQTFIEALPKERIKEFHLAGPDQNGEFLIDTHDHPVRDEVWNLYRKILPTCQNVPTLLEWDAKIPSAEELSSELDKARQIYKQTLSASLKETSNEARI